MKILITGVAGFIGRNLVPLLKKNGHYVIGLDIYTEIKSELYEVLDDYRQYDLLIRGDISDVVNNLDYVVHLAGEASVNANKNQLKTKNELATAYLVEALAKNKNQKIIFLSSAKVSSQNKYYAKSKKRSENKIIFSSINSDLKYTILRCAVIYGKGMKSNLMRWLKNVQIGSIRKIPPNNSEISMIGISDLCQIISGCIGNFATDNKTYLVTDGHSYRINEIETVVRNINPDNINKIYPKLIIYIAAKIGDILQIIGVKFPLNSGAYYMFFKNKVKHDSRIYNDLGIQPTQNFLEEIPALLAE